MKDAKLNLSLKSKNNYIHTQKKLEFYFFSNNSNLINYKFRASFISELTEADI